MILYLITITITQLLSILLITQLFSKHSPHYSFSYPAAQHFPHHKHSPHYSLLLSLSCLVFSSPPSCSASILLTTHPITITQLLNILLTTSILLATYLCLLFSSLRAEMSNEENSSIDMICHTYLQISSMNMDM